MGLRLGAKKSREREDIVAASLSEIVLFFLFFCLILLASVWTTDGISAEEYIAACGDDPSKCLNEELISGLIDKCGIDGSLCEVRSDEEEPPDLGELIALCGENGAKCGPITIIMGLRDELNSFIEKCGEDAQDCVGRPVFEGLESRLAIYIALCGEDADGCVGKPEYEDLEREYKFFVDLCGKDRQKCVGISEFDALMGKYTFFLGLCGENGTKCVPEDEHREFADTNALYRNACRGDPRQCAALVDVQGDRNDLEAFRDACGEDPTQCVRTLDRPTSFFLRHQDGYLFDTGKSIITPEFIREFRTGSNGRISGLTQMTREIQKIRELESDFVIEVIGHTDTKAFSKGACNSNLDRVLIDYTNNNQGVDPIACDNAGLGLARASSTARFLKSELERYYPDLISGLKIVPYSAGQLQPRTYELATRFLDQDDETRRRIEIRISLKMDNNQQ